MKKKTLTGKRLSNLSSGNTITAQQMGILEAFGGHNPVTTIGCGQANHLAQRYQQLENMVFSQSHLKKVYGGDTIFGSAGNNFLTAARA